MPARERPTARVGVIDLATGPVKVSELATDTADQYLGGRAAGIRLLQDYRRVSVDALGPDNVVLSTGLLGGMVAPAASMTYALSVSPEGGLAGASLGGFFGPELRWAGLDHLIIVGKSAGLSYLLVHDGKIEIKDARSLSGESTLATQERLLRELDDDCVQCLSIGPAGEKLVPFAGVVSGHENPARQRGLGAVFGAKNLKAIAVRGTRGLPVKFPEKALDYNEEMVRSIRASQVGRQLESAGAVYFDDERAATAIDSYSIGRSGCFGCQLRCRYRYLLKEGTAAGALGETVDCLTRAAWDAVFGPERTASVLAAGHWLQSYGLDPLETAGLVRWAMSLYQRGRLTDRETGGLELEASNDAAVFELMGRIGRREGLGDVLALGRARAAEKILPANDQDNASLDLHLNAAQGLSLAASVFHPDYLFALPPGGEDGLAAAAYERALCSTAAAILGICDLQTAVLAADLPGFAEFSEMVYLNTGVRVEPDRLREAAARALTLERLLSQRTGAPAAPATPALVEYFRLAGWDERGVPRPDTLERLGLGAKP